MTSLTATVGRTGRDWDDAQFRIIFAICLPACVCAAALRRAHPRFWSARSAHRPLFVESWAAAGTAARLALAG